MVRQIQLCLVLGALAACSGGSEGKRPPVAFATAQDAVRTLCISPSSHGEIVKAVRALGWPMLGDSEIPEQVVGNGSVNWSRVAMSPSKDMIIAAGRLGGTSFCQVYARHAQAELVEQHLERLVVLGAPLGKPDDRRRIDGHDVTGWRRRVGSEWHAVHLSMAAPRSTQPSAMPVMIEVTRSAT